MLNLTHLATFLAVIEEGGFHEAARRLQRSQPTVSQHVRKLEAAVGTPLVRRSHARCTPTAHGARLLPHARRLLKAARQAEAAVEEQGLLIGASSNIGTYLLPSRLSAFLGERGAGAPSTLSLASNPQVAEQLGRGELDVALMEWWDHRPGIEARVWRREPLVVIVAPDHPWAGRAEVGRAELLSTPMLGGEPGSGTATLLRQAFGPAAEALALSWSLGSTEAVKRAVRAGIGISLVLAAAVQDEVAAGHLCALPVAGATLSKELFALLPEAMPPGASARAFVAHLQAAGGAD